MRSPEEHGHISKLKEETAAKKKGKKENETVRFLISSNFWIACVILALVPRSHGMNAYECYAQCWPWKREHLILNYQGQHTYLFGCGADP
jgi:hypothetical protein